MLTLGRLVVGVIGIAAVVLFGLQAWLILRDWLSLAVEGATRPRLLVGSPTEAAFFLALAIVSLVGLAFLARWRSERQSWIGAALIGVGPAAIAGLGLKLAVESTLVDFRPQDWLGWLVAWGAATVVCFAVAMAFRRPPDARPAV